MDLKPVLVDEAGLEVVLVGVPQQVGEDLRLLFLSVEVQDVVHRVIRSQAGAALLVRFRSSC